ncbi:coiled-coil domain-containing protein 170 [Microcaecilia unicolor]|uniref:Coiled-coil domain-containing protein 170 n=1 Tax=Microcaecilia unicolor TaxID=1415580 RepID=A0A6P7XP70_9AMPH|nr:coiled-coil domain-containing protein 170 [Microcaecilia unicolor]
MRSSNSSSNSNPRKDSACDSESRFIDVNSNAAFRPFSPSKRYEPEVQEQVNLLKRQMEGKEDFTASHSIGRTKGRAEVQKRTYEHLLDMPITREQMNHYRVQVETARSELAALHVKFECAQAELLDLRTRLNSREVSLQELKNEVESYKENNARQSSLISSLRGRVQEMDEESGLLVTSKTRAEIAAQAVLQENQEMKEKIQEQEARLNKYVTQWEESKSQASRHSRNYSEFLAQLADCMEVDTRSKEKPQDILFSKVSKLREENLALKGRIVSLEETINVHEMESKASRETIMRLVSEVNREQKKLATYTEEMETLRKDLDCATEAKQSLERDSRILQDKVLANQRAWEASKQELMHLKKTTSELDGNLRSSLGEAKFAQNLFSTFKEQVTDLLSSSSSSVLVKPSEEAILDRIRDVLYREESKKILVSQLESRISKVTEQLQIQTQLHQEALQRAEKAEQQLEDVRARLARLEGELASGEVLQEGLSIDKQKYLKFLEQLSDKMKLEWVAADVGFDMRLEAALARAEQLVKLEGDAVVETKTLAHGLQRKLKSQKEKLESKELHMSLLQKKIAQLEEEKQVRTALAVERDDANLMIRKLQKRVERLQGELSTAQESNTELRAKLSDTNELKIRTLEQNKAIEELSKSLERVEKVKEKAQKKLVSVKSELDFTEEGARKEKERAKSMLEALTSELSTLKKSFEEVVKRERQLVDFREVVSRTLGLNVNTLALPDYEIIKRLEMLAHIHQHHVVTCA